jgi:hypothetical protein
MKKFPNKLKAMIFLINYPTSYFALLEDGSDASCTRGGVRVRRKMSAMKITIRIPPRYSAAVKGSNEAHFHGRPTTRVTNAGRKTYP